MIVDGPGSTELIIISWYIPYNGQVFVIPAALL